jgi:Spy/CpxP family protein refolding chaperone
MRLALLALVALLALPAHAFAQDHAGHAEHAGKETREIKALSADEVAALLAGEGAGMALAAELNRYPGPRHVLDLRDALALTPSQHEQVSAIYDAMNARARSLGRQLVERERELDRAFADRSITPERLRELTAAIGALQAELRSVHLDAHLATTALLTPEQIRRYDHERGYGHH